MLKGLGDIGALVKMQKEFKAAQKSIAGATREGTSAGGGVRAVVNGEHRLTSIAIDPAILKSASAGDLEKMIVAAVNDAADQLKAFAAAEMEKLAGGLNIPGIADFLR
jgi:DNA-binding YbaB/EbfC family protein